MHLTQGLQRAAQTKPDGVSTIFRDRRRTWRETEDRIARLAGGLRRCGTGQGRPCGDPGAEQRPLFRISVRRARRRAASRCRSTPAWRAPEIAYILEDSGATMLFIDGTFAPVLAQLDGRLGAVRDIVYLDDDALPAGMRRVRGPAGCAALHRRDRPGRRRRRHLLYRRHHRPGEGRDADAPQPGDQRGQHRRCRRL